MFASLFWFSHSLFWRVFWFLKILDLKKRVLKNLVKLKMVKNQNKLKNRTIYTAFYQSMKQTQISDKKKLFTETSYFSTFFGARPLRQNLLICYIHSTVAIFCIVWSKYLTSIQNDQNYCLKVKTLGKYAQVDVENTGWS